MSCTLFARGGWGLSRRGQNEEDKQAKKHEPGKVQALKIGRNAAGRSPQQADGSGMSHVTRMGPTPAPTQILSAVLSHFLRLAGKEAVSGVTQTSHKSAALFSDASGSPVGMNS